MKPSDPITLTAGKRVLFLTKDPDLIRRQLAGELELVMEDLSVEDLLDDINTDAMTPAWVCFNHRPEDLAREAYAGLIVDGESTVSGCSSGTRSGTATSKSSSRGIARGWAARVRRRCRRRSGAASGSPSPPLLPPSMPPTTSTRAC
jgi:hypothetical protein